MHFGRGATILVWVAACRAQAAPGAADRASLDTIAIVETDVMVPMRDGVKLATDIVRPRRPGRFPVLLSRTPYGKRPNRNVYAVRHGMALAVQDVRGRYGSQGAFYPFTPDIHDGHDTVEWLARQPWCNGQVSMTGGSYAGFTQLATALAHPPHLRCIMPSVPPAHFDRRVLFQGGALRQSLVQGWILAQSWRGQRVLRDRVPEAERDRWQPFRSITRWCRHLPLADPGPIAIGGPGYAQAWRDIITGWEDPTRWRQVSAAVRPEAIHVPVLITGGFYDIFAQGNIDLVLALRRRGGSEVTRRHSHLMIGPWAHGIGRPAGDATFPHARRTAGRLPHTWMAHWVRGRAAEPGDAPAIRAYVIGQDRWISTPTWPPARSVPTRIYLSRHGLSRRPPDGDELPSTFVYDPANPVPTRGGNNLMIARGMRDHRPHAARPDVLSFLSDPLDADLVVIGRLRVHLFVSTSAADTDFTAMLLDVRPDGYRANVQDGIVRLRYRHGRGQPDLVEPGRVVEADIDLWSTAWAFKKGHRIGLHVSSSNFPRFDRHMNTAEPPATWTRPRKATNRVHHAAAHASYIELPVFP